MQHQTEHHSPLDIDDVIDHDVIWATSSDIWWHGDIDWHACFHLQVDVETPQVMYNLTFT